MNRQFLRSFVRRLGFDGMARDRFDLLAASADAAPTYPRLLAQFFSLYAATRPEIWLLQLGANDGSRDDHAGFLREPAHVRSILVEPQTACVARLRQQAAAHPNWTVLPCAFAEQDGTATLHRFDRAEEKGIQLDVFASFDRALLEEKKRYFPLEAGIVAEQVEACSLPTLLRRGGAPRVDILLCDIEGLDHAVIAQLPRLDPLPEIVAFEHRWLTVAQRRASYALLDSLGYAVLHGNEDAWCYRLRT